MSEARLYCAACAVILWLLLCAWAWLRHRRAHCAGEEAARVLDAPRGDDAVLVVHASQTGLAAQLAERTAQSLRAGGLAVRVAGMDRLAAAQLRGWRRVLFIASTYGEGDPPDSAAAFADRAMRAPADLHGLRHAVLALGDSSYARFCGFGRRLDAWLHGAGAQALFERIDVDRGDATALSRWQRQLATLAGRTELPGWEEPAGQPWRLVRRELLNPEGMGAPCYHLELVPADGRLPQWRAGDIAQVRPRGASGQWLAQRDYSIASLPADGAVHLLVRQMRHDDGRLGAGSGWLTELAAPGEEIAMSLRANPSFHAPAGGPLILVGSGTGLAGLRALIKARAAAGRHENWLVFGERSAAHDYFYRDDIEAWRAQGVLARVDAVFSREPPARRYVQHVLAESADELRLWVARGAAIYVCGSLRGMAAGVDEALAAVLGRQALQQLAGQGRYRRDVY